MATYRLIKSIALQNKYKLILTYSLYFVEMFFLLLRPYYLGKAVDGLLDGKYNGLLLLIGSYLIWIILSTIRQLYDTRVYSKIYTDLISRTFHNRNKGEHLSKMSAKSNLARELIDFLAYDFNYTIEALYNIVGSLIMLLIYDRIVVVVCVIILIPVIFLSYNYSKKVKVLTKNKNDELEKQVDAISSLDPQTIKNHYSLLRKWEIKIAEKEAWNFGILEIIILVVISSSLFLTTNKKWEIGFLAGDIIGIYNYILKFVGGLDTIPYMIQKLNLITDISSRLENPHDSSYKQEK